MKKKVIALLTCAFALCFTLALAGCTGGGTAGGSAGGNGGGNAAPDPAKEFIGTWELSGMVADGDTMEESDIKAMKQLGLNVDLYLCEDKTVTLDLFGEQMTGTWEAKDASTATITLEGSPADATLKDGKLEIRSDEDYMTFSKTSDTAVVPAASSSGSSSSSSGSTPTTTEAVEEVLVDDEYCTITFLGAGVDFSGDPGFNLRILNKTDKTVWVSSEYGTFSVNGKMCDPVLSETLKPGKYAEAFMWFNSSDVPDGVDGLVDVEGTITICDDSTYDDITSYEFKY